MQQLYNNKKDRKNIEPNSISINVRTLLRFLKTVKFYRILQTILQEICTRKQ